MPGASGIKATNYLYAAAPKDGTVIATVNNSMPVYQAIGQDGVRFKAEELNWIGSLLQTATTVSIWHTAGVKTIEDAKKKEVIMGATGAAGTKAAYPALLNNTVGTKFKIVTGYEGGNTASPRDGTRRGARRRQRALVVLEIDQAGLGARQQNHRPGPDRLEERTTTCRTCRC